MPLRSLEPDSLSMRSSAFCSGRFGILGNGPMRILFAISLVALGALLWASVSIAQHIYRSRQRQRTAPRKPASKPLETVLSSPKALSLEAAEEQTQRRKAS